MRVVLALDGSDSSIRARDLVAGLPWPAGTSMTMVTVSAVPAAWFAPGEPARDWFPRAEEAMGQEAADQLAPTGHAARGPWLGDRASGGA